MDSLVDPQAVLPRQHSIPVLQVRQSHSWDCGLACVLMVLRSVGVASASLEELQRLCQTNSIWTVDLAHLLRHFGIPVTLITITIGANPSYAGERFYKDSMRQDEERVNDLFNKAEEVGIRLEQRSVTADELARLILSGRFLIIALVDKLKLMPAPALVLPLPDFLAPAPGYTGHYILICGYDADSRQFEIRDPASSSASLNISVEDIDIARRAFGTDEDLLLISLEQGKGWVERSTISEEELSNQNIHGPAMV